MKKRISLGGRSRELDSRKTHEDIINCYREVNQDGEFQRITRAPGFKLNRAVGDGPIRGMYVAAGILYVVSGSEFYKVNVSPFGALSPVKVGDVSGQAGNCVINAIATDEPQVQALTSGTGYIWNESTDTFTEITDPDYDPDYGLASFNQRFWLNRPNSNEFFGSEILDGLDYDSLFFASAENNPDHLRNLQATNTEIVLFGSESTERWQDIQIAEGFPLRRVQGGTLDRGIGAQRSLAKWESTLFWLADDNTVRMLQGGRMTKISDIFMEKSINNYSQPSLAFGFFVDYSDYKCYCITFPSNNVTWCFDVLRGFWHKRRSTGFDGWRISNSVNLNGMVLLGDRDNGNIYTMDASLNTENGVETVAEWITPPETSNDIGYSVTLTELIADAGVGPITNVSPGTGQIENSPIKPYMSAFWSIDGGFSYNEFPQRHLGTRGDRAHRITWRTPLRVPLGKDLVYRFSSSGDWPFNIYSGHIQVRGGNVPG